MSHLSEPRCLSGRGRATGRGSMTTTVETPTNRRGNRVPRRGGRVVEFVERRMAASGWVRRIPRRAFPNHWSLWLGYIALFSFVVIIVSGVFLTVWFEPSMAPVEYDGAYALMQGVVVSEAYASTLDISFETRGGLLTRQVHYWATHVFIAAMSIHLLQVFFTGAFRKPRQRNWLIGLGLLVLGIVGGYTGHALPDDLLSGTGLRVVEGGMRSIPIVGTSLSSFIFGGEYPGEDIIGRLHVVHVFVIPALIIVLLIVHLVLARRHGRTQWGGAGKTNRTVVGSPFPVHIARASGLALIVAGLIVLMAATLQINPVWLWGPADPSQASAGSQPDWYVGFLDGAQRLMPPVDIHVFGYELALSVLVPVILLPGVLVTALAIYPWIEQKITGDTRDQHILDRPRTVPARTGLGAAFIVFYLLLWIAGGNDILATTFHVSVNFVTRFLQVAVILLPPLAYAITKRICLGLLREDRDKLLHGLETGRIIRGPDGGYSETHVPLSQDDAHALTQPERRVLHDPEPELDENGIPAPRPRWSKLRTRLSKSYFGDDVHTSAAEEISHDR
ncbi:MAG: ubiquinol-cytochrome c reductase cytochrome b subunit [Propionibacteriales bacterium]|nr:ubiquinol-cytochrome c reductase cytochrome b subunit [Propionibacteriales bacterium]